MPAEICCSRVFGGGGVGVGVTVGVGVAVGFAIVELYLRKTRNLESLFATLRTGFAAGCKAVALPRRELPFFAFGAVPQQGRSPVIQ